MLANRVIFRDETRPICRSGELTCSASQHPVTATIAPLNMNKYMDVRFNKLSTY